MLLSGAQNIYYNDFQSVHLKQLKRVFRIGKNVVQALKIRKLSKLSDFVAVQHERGWTDYTVTNGYKINGHVLFPFFTHIVSLCLGRWDPVHDPSPIRTSQLSLKLLN